MLITLPAADLARSLLLISMTFPLLILSVLVLCHGAISKQKEVCEKEDCTALQDKNDEIVERLDKINTTRAELERSTYKLEEDLGELSFSRAQPRKSTTSQPTSRPKCTRIMQKLQPSCSSSNKS